MSRVMFRRSRKDLLAVAILLLASCLFFYPALSSGLVFGSLDIASAWPLTAGIYHGIHNPAISDQGQQFSPWFYLDWVSIRAGQLPLWNRYTLLGMPQFLNFQSAPLSLPTVISYFFPVQASYLVNSIAILFISGLGAYLFARVIGLTILPALCVALAFEFCGAQANWSVPLSAGNAYLGFILAASYLLLTSQQHRRRNVTLLAVAVAFSLYAGHPESCIIVLVTALAIIAPLLVLQLWRHEVSWSRVATFALWNLAGALLGVLLAAPLLLPGQQIIAAGARGSHAQSPVPLHMLMSIIVPDYYGTPEASSVLFGPAPFLMGMAGIGVICVILAVYGAIRNSRTSLVLALCVGLGVLMLLSYDVRIVQVALDSIPVLGNVYFDRCLVGVDFILAVMAGFGLQAMQEDIQTHNLRGIQNRPLLPLLTLWGLGGGLSLVLFGLFVTTRHATWLTAAERSVRLHSLVAPILLSLLVPVMALAARRWPALMTNVASVVILAGQAGFLIASEAPLNTFSQTFYPANTQIQQVQHIVGDNLLGTFGTDNPAWFNPYGFMPDTSSAYGVRQFGVYDPLLPRVYWQSWNEVTRQPDAITHLNDPSVQIFDPSIDTAAEARTYGIGYLMGPPTSYTFAKDSSQTIALALHNSPLDTASDSGAVQYLLTYYIGRSDLQVTYPWSHQAAVSDVALWATRKGGSSDPQLDTYAPIYQQLISYLAGHPSVENQLRQALVAYTDQGLQLVLSTPSYRLYAVPGASQFSLESEGLPSGVVTSSVWVNNYTLQLHVVATRPSTLIARITNIPGWQVTVNGASVPTKPYLHVMQQFAVPAGASTVTMTYWPSRLTIGIWLAIAGLAILILWWLLEVVARWRGLGSSARDKQEVEIAFDLLDSLKTTAVRLPRVETTRTIDSTARLIASGSADPLSLSHSVQDDDDFFDALMAGISALLNANFWMASRLLSTIVDIALRPNAYTPHTAGSALAAEVRFTSPWSLREREAFARELVSRRSSPISPQDVTAMLDYLAGKYQAVADAYIQSRASASGEPATVGASQQRYYEWLRRYQPHPVLATQQVVTWQRLSIVLPAYNEQEVIAKTVRSCLAVVRAYCPNTEVIVVDDGSRDRTGGIADDIAWRNAGVVVLHNRPNRGYGGALRVGFSAARGDLVFFMDSDGQFDISEIRTLLLEETREPGAAILGYRTKRSDPFMRKLNAAWWKRAAQIVVGLRGIRDIDCAFKLLPARQLRQCAIQAEGASINVEFLAKLQRQRVPIVQVPVSHYARTQGRPTGANWRFIVRAFKELYRLRHHLRSWTPVSVEGDTMQEAVTPTVTPSVTALHYDLR